MEINEADIAVFIQQYFFPFCRIAMMLMVMPVVGSRVISARIRLLFAVVLAVVVVPILPPVPVSEMMSMQSMLVILKQLGIGALMGFTFQLVFQVFVLSGQFMAMKMGLGFAMMNDPTNGVQTTVISQFFLILTTVMFVSVDAHLYLISAVIESFHVLPIDHSPFRVESLLRMSKLGSWLFATALVFALPVLSSLLIVNVAFGVMSRAAPQLNIFAVGFPFTLLCGLGLIWIGLANYIDGFERNISTGFQWVHEFIHGS